MSFACGWKTDWKQCYNWQRKCPQRIRFRVSNRFTQTLGSLLFLLSLLRPPHQNCFASDITTLFCS